MRHRRSHLVRHLNLDCRPGILPPTEVQDGAGRGRVEDEEQDGLLQVQLRRMRTQNTEENLVIFFVAAMKECRN